MHTAARTHGFTESVIRGMTRLANEHGAINLAQGFPNFPAPEVLKEAAARAIRDDVNQYAITWGAKRLRDALVAKYAEWYGLRVDPETEVTVTCGATEAMASALLAIVDPGDEVIVFEPFYENYGPDAILCGAKPVYVPMAAGAELDLDRRARRGHGRDPEGARLPHGRCTGAPAGGRGDRARDAGAGVLPRPRRRLPRPAGPPLRRARRGRVPLHAPRGRLLHPGGLLRDLRPTRRRVRALAHLQSGRRTRPRLELLQPAGARTQARAVRVLQDGGAAQGGGGATEGREGRYGAGTARAAKGGRSPPGGGAGGGA